jgi:hypothetical protein
VGHLSDEIVSLRALAEYAGCSDHLEAYINLLRIPMGDKTSLQTLAAKVVLRNYVADQLATTGEYVQLTAEDAAQNG